MKIVIYVDYSNINFNKDFNLANTLLDRGHHVFLVINDNQLHMYDNKYDKLFVGFSSDKVLDDCNYIKVTNNQSVDEIVANNKL